MRNLGDIIEDCKLGGRPDYDELFYGLLVLNTMYVMTYNGLKRELLEKHRASSALREVKAQVSFDMFKNAMNKSPKEFLGWNNDPSNPEYQKVHKAHETVFDSAVKAEWEGGK